MQVYKFGGTSVGSVIHMNHVKEIISGPKQKVVVLSAMAGTTDALVNFSDSIAKGQRSEALMTLKSLRDLYRSTVKDLLKTEALHKETSDYIERIFKELEAAASQNHDTHFHNIIVSKGELLSTFMFSKLLQQEGFDVALLPALDFMRTNQNQEPDSFYIKQNLERCMNRIPKAHIYITQGFICLDELGNVSNLKRGGSDYTATLIGAALEAEEVQIWTDIDGFHNNDPRYVENTKALAHLSFEEAAELAYFGAKILHPQTVLPVRELDIPLRLKNTMAPEAEGTLISNKVVSSGLKSIAAKDGITAIKIKSVRMLLAHGFLKKVFEVFERYKTPIDMVTTSEIAVSLTIDNNQCLQQICEELQEFATVEVDEDMTIICLVGHQITYHEDTPRLFKILNDVQVRMIAYGGSHNNISILVHYADKLDALQKLQAYCFNDKPLFKALHLN